MLHNKEIRQDHFIFGTLIVELQGLGLELGVDFTFAWDNNNNKNNNDKNPHLNFWKGTR